MHTNAWNVFDATETKANSVADYPCVFVYVIFKIISLCDDIFGDDVVKVDTHCRCERAILVFCQPSYFGCFLEIL